MNSIDEIINWPYNDTERTETIDPVEIYRNEIDQLLKMGKTPESGEWQDIDRKMDLIYGKSGAEEIRNTIKIIG